jgi:hypothetical protein
MITARFSTVGSPVLRIKKPLPSRRENKKDLFSVGRRGTRMRAEELDSS